MLQSEVRHVGPAGGLGRARSGQYKGLGNNPLLLKDHYKRVLLRIIQALALLR